MQTNIEKRIPRTRERNIEANYANPSRHTETARRLARRARQQAKMIAYAAQ